MDGCCYSGLRFDWSEGGRKDYMYACMLEIESGCIAEWEYFHACEIRDIHPHAFVSLYSRHMYVSHLAEVRNAKVFYFTLPSFSLSIYLSIYLFNHSLSSTASTNSLLSSVYAYHCSQS